MKFSTLWFGYHGPAWSFYFFIVCVIVLLLMAVSYRFLGFPSQRKPDNGKSANRSKTERKFFYAFGLLYLATVALLSRLDPFEGIYWWTLLSMPIGIVLF